MSSAVQTPAKGRPGLFNTNSYLSSGIPWVSGSVLPSSSYASNNGQVLFEFPYVTRSVTVINRRATDIRIHFNSVNEGNVIGGRHYITLSEARDSITFVYKVKAIYVSLVDGSDDGEIEVMAELTNIPRQEMFSLTGSGLTD